MTVSTPFRGPLVLLLALSGLLLAPLCAARAQVQLPALPSVAAPGAPRHVVTGDFSGDGRRDLAVTAPATGRIRILLLTEEGDFIGGALVPVGGEPEGLFTDDFDRDGDADLAWTDLRSGNVGVILLSPGNPPAWQLLTRTGPDEPTAAVLVDTDADDWPDLVTAHAGADELVRYPNEQGSPGTARPEPAGDRPDRLLRLDHPGGPTLALRQSGRLSRNVQLTNLADGTRRTLPLPGGGEIFDVDVDGDGIDELLVAEEDVGEIVVRSHDGGAWSESRRFAVDRDVCGVAAATVSPGVRRLAVGSRGRRRVALYAVTPTAIVRESNWYSGGGMGDVRYEDVDGDGAADVLVAQANLQRLQLMPPLGSGVLAMRAASVPAGGRSIARGVDDGGELLLAVPGAEAAQVGVYRVEGVETREPLLLEAVPGVRAARFAELDGQPGIDLGSVSRTGGFRVHRADGSGGFVAAGGFTPTGDVADLCFVDVVGGPALDLLLARLDPPALVVHEGVGDGSFSPVPAAEIATSEPLVVVRAEDLDLDGREDVVALGFESLLTIFLNRAGSGLAGVDLLVDNAPRDLAFGRFNADAYPDIVTINEGNADFTVVTSLLPGVYTVAVRGNDTLPGASRIEVSDFDLDGVDDFCVIASATRSVGIHFNNGTPDEPLTRFTPPVQFELCESGVDFAAVDLDGDGRPDLLGLDGEADVLVTRLSDPFGAVARPMATIEVETRDAARVVHVFSDAEYAHDLRLLREPGHVLLALEQVATGSFEAVDTAALAEEAVYVVEDRRGTELDRVSVSGRIGTAAPAASPPVLLPVRYEPGRAVLRMRAAAGVVPEVRIYDLRGRRVARLELVPQGERWFEGAWAGTDLRGRPVSRGRYLVRASLGSVVATGSVQIR